MSSEDVDEELVTVGWPEDKGGPFVEGSTLEECEECGVGVWISPATQSAIAQGIASDRIWCLECAAEDAREGGPE